MKKLSFICAIILSFLLTCCTTPEVDYRDKWVGKYEYFCSNGQTGTLKVKKIGSDGININIIDNVTSGGSLTVGHDGAFWGTANTNNHQYPWINGMFVGQDSLYFDYYSSIALGAGTFVHRCFKAKKISSTL